MIPILYASNETNFNTNGIGHLQETMDYSVREVRNGEFELFLEYPVTGKLFSELKDFRLILAKPNELDADHLFRIYEMVKDAATHSILVYASTRSNDLGGNMVSNVKVTNETPQSAMNKMKANLIQPTDYNFVSDINTTSSTDWVRRNPLNCIAGEEGSLVNYWGGEIKRTNDTIYLYSRRGKDKVVTVRPGKNLGGFKVTASTKGMITRMLPYFSYTPAGRDTPVTVVGTIVDSPLVNNYPVKYITSVDFSSDDTVKTLAQLNTAANRYFAYMNPGCDKPNVNIDVDLMQLSDSSEYSKFKALERIGLTDTVIVWVEKFDVDVEVKVNEITYNGMKNQVTNIVAGSQSHTLYDDVKKTYMQSISNLQQYVKGMENGILNTIQISADGKNTIFRGYTEPVVSISKLNDLWYKELGSGEVEVWIFDGAYWQPLIHSGVSAEIRASLDAAIVEINKAKADADSAVIKADQAIVDAGFAGINSTEAKANALTALDNASTAVTNANTALVNANTARTDSTTAIGNAQIALDAYNNLQIGGRNLIKNSQYLILYSNSSGRGTSTLRTDESVPYYRIVSTTNTISTYEWSIYSWLNSNGVVGRTYTIGVDVRVTEIADVGFDPAWEQFTIAQPNVWTRIFHTFQYVTGYFPSGLEANKYALDYRNWKLEDGNVGTSWTPSPEDVQVQITDINGELSRKVNQTAYNTLNGTVTSQGTLISQSQTDIALKANTSTVNTLSGTVATQGTSITANSTAIALKADTSTVDTLSSTVTTQGTSITANATAIALKANTTTVNTLSSTVTTQGTSITANATAIALKAEKSVVDTISGKVTTNTSNITANATAIALRLTSAQVESAITGKNYVNQTTLNATSSGLSASITQVSTDLAGLEIGGRNLIVAGTLEKGKYLLETTGLLNSYPTHSATDFIPTDANTAYIVSTKTRLNQIRIVYYNSSKTYISGILYSGEQGKSKIVTTPPNTAFIKWSGDENFGDPLNLWKVEKGNKATDWSPAPEDMATVERAVQIEATINGIQTTVANKADNSQITQLSTQISSKVESSTYTSKMTQLDSAINLRVTSGDVTSAILADKTIKDTRNDNQLPSWYASNFPKQAVEEFKTRTVMGVSGSAVYGRLETKVIWNHTSGGAMTQVFSSSDGEFRRYSNSAYTAWSAWEQTAEVSNLVAQINLSPSGLYIQGKNIQLDGNVSMTDAFITRLKAVEVIADKITSGTLNAANVNILNLNVDKLVGNKTNFIQSNWNQLNSSLSINSTGLISQSGSMTTVLNAGEVVTTVGTKKGTVNALGMNIYDSSIGMTTELNSDGINFDWYGVKRSIIQNSEGLEIKAFTGSSNRLNSALFITTGPGADKVAYLQLTNPTSGNVARLQLEGNSNSLTLRHPNGGQLEISDYNYNGALGVITSGKLRTTTTDGRGIEMAVSQIKAMAGNQTIYIMPSGSGELRIGNGGSTPTLWPVRALSFVQGSSKDYKTNISDYEIGALSILNSIKVVQYDLNRDVELGIENKQIGFISENSTSISSLDGKGIDIYRTTAVSVRGIQQLSEIAHSHEIKIAELVNEIKLLKGAV